MGDLVRTPYSEVTATLELLDLLGVTREHLARLRSNRQIAERVVALIRCGEPVQFAPGVLEAVQALGGQFAQARVTGVPGGETLESQRKDKVIRFWTDWHFKRLGKNEQLSITPSLFSEVIYLPDVVEGSLRCTFDKVEDRDCVRDILDRLPRVEGLRWIVGNPPTVCRVLADHLRETSEYLLPGVYTWTDGIYQSPKYGLRRVLVGDFVSAGGRCRPGRWGGDFGLFVLGVPKE